MPAFRGPLLARLEWSRDPRLPWQALPAGACIWCVGWRWPLPGKDLKEYYAFKLVAGTGLWELWLGMSQWWPHQRWQQGQTFLARCLLRINMVISSVVLDLHNACVASCSVVPRPLLSSSTGLCSRCPGRDSRCSCKSKDNLWKHWNGLKWRMSEKRIWHFTKVAVAGTQAAFVAAILSAICEPLAATLEFSPVFPYLRSFCIAFQFSLPLVAKARSTDFWWSAWQ